VLVWIQAFRKTKKAKHIDNSTDQRLLAESR